MFQRLALLLILFSPRSSVAEAPPEDPLAAARFLEGSWSGKGSGKWGAFTQTVEVSPILDRRGLQLNVSNGDFDMVGLLVVDAAGDWQATWADQAGVVATYTGKVVKQGKNTTLVLAGSFTWEGKTHHNERRWTLTPAGRLDYVFTGTAGGSEVVYNRSTLAPVERK